MVVTVDGARVITRMTEDVTAAEPSRTGPRPGTRTVLTGFDPLLNRAVDDGSCLACPHLLLGLPCLLQPPGGRRDDGEVLSKGQVSVANVAVAGQGLRGRHRNQGLPVVEVATLRERPTFSARNAQGVEVFDRSIHDAESCHGTYPPAAPVSLRSFSLLRVRNRFSGLTRAFTPPEGGCPAPLLLHTPWVARTPVYHRCQSPSTLRLFPLRE